MLTAGSNLVLIPRLPRVYVVLRVLLRNCVPHCPAEHGVAVVAGPLTATKHLRALMTLGRPKPNKSAPEEKTPFTFYE